MTPRPYIRVVSAALAVLWVTMPAAAAVHGAIDAHEYCAEHQAFEHRVATAAPRVGVDVDVGEAIEAYAAQDQHDDCAFDEVLLREGVRVGPPAVARVAPCAVDDARAACREVVTPIAVLATAPKTSPPAP